MLTPEQILERYNSLCDHVRNEVSSPRKEQLLSLFETYSMQICTAPASANTSYHDCYPGGYVDHVGMVVETALTMYNTYLSDKNLSTLLDFTREELVFSAVVHDLGKLGDLVGGEDYYIPNDSDWHVKRGMVYKKNPNLSNIQHSQRSLMNLQTFGIPCNEKEYTAILLHDGLYVDANKSSLISYNDGKPHSNLTLFLHHADITACMVSKAKQKVEPSSVNKELSPTNKGSKFRSLNNPGLAETFYKTIDATSEAVTSSTEDIDSIFNRFKSQK